MAAETLLATPATTTEGQTEAQGTLLASQDAKPAETTQPAPETKPAEKAEAPKSDVPESYDFKAPEGQTFDGEVLKAYGEWAKDSKLSQDAAQKGLDKLAPVLQARQQARIAAVQAEWAESAKADKEFGGDKLPENLSIAKKALDTFGSPALRQLLEESGLGNHPEVIRLLFKAGKAVSADTFVGSGGNVSQRSAAQVLYE